MSRWSPGTTAELTATFTDESGNPVDPETIEVDIYTPDEVQVIDNGVPVQISQGFYRYDHPLPVDASEGLWRIEWKVIQNGLLAHGDEVFEVLSSDIIITPSDSIMHSRLRAALGESKVDPVGDGSETFFDDDAITDLLSYANGNLELAILEGWRRKMARYARLVDVSESGSTREMSQKFKNAKAMVDFWARIIGDVEAATSAALNRVVGRAVNLGQSDEPLHLSISPFSDYSEHIRMYPTHRFLMPAILS